MQMDIEMLFLHALEKYAQIHHISEKETLKLFQEYQVYEKLVTQYEILHQVDFSESMKSFSVHMKKLLYIMDQMYILRKLT